MEHMKSMGVPEVLMITAGMSTGWLARTVMEGLIPKVYEIAIAGLATSTPKIIKRRRRVAARV